MIVCHAANGPGSANILKTYDWDTNKNIIAVKCTIFL